MDNINHVVVSGEVTDVDPDLGFKLDGNLWVGILGYFEQPQHVVGEHVVVYGKLQYNEGQDFHWLKASKVA